MQLYFQNKLLSVLITFTIIGIISFVSNIQTQWRLLLIAVVLFGQGHFITSYIYQARSFKRKLPKVRGVLLFLTLIGFFATILMYLRFGLQRNDLALFFLGAYFIVHNTLNERTMLVSFTRKEQNSYIATIAVLLLFLWVYFGTVSEESFSFVLNPNLTVVSNLGTNLFYDIVFPNTFFLESVVLFLVLGFTIAYTIKERSGKALLIFFGILSILVACRLFGFISSFLYLMAFIIIYHYVTWFLYFIPRMKDEGGFLERRSTYFKINFFTYLFLIAVFVVGNVFAFAEILYFIVFSVEMFLLWTFLHITATLINEGPIEKLFKV